jgi:ORF6N domain
MSSKAEIVLSENIERSIVLIRGHSVMLDSDLAHLYGVHVKKLNEQVRRNRRRFPADYMIQLTSEEFDALRS